MTMRSLNVARVLLLATTLCFSTTAIAQKHGKKPPKKPNTPAANSGGEIELDAPATTAAPTTGAPVKAVDNSPPPQAGQMTEAAAQAKRLFDGEKWQDAA